MKAAAINEPAAVEEPAAPHEASDKPESLRHQRRPKAAFAEGDVAAPAGASAPRMFDIG